MFWIGFAAQLSLPIAVGMADYRDVFSPDDMPAYVQIAEVNRFVGTRTTVGPDGKTRDCTIERASGDSELDALTCAIIVQRAKFQPAQWVDGSPVFAVLRTTVSWTIGGPPSKREMETAFSADMDLSVSRLPAGAGKRKAVNLMIGVDEVGKITGCAAAPRIPERDHSKAFPELISIACQQLISQYRPVPVKDASGTPVRSVQTASVLFKTGN